MAILFVTKPQQRSVTRVTVHFTGLAQMANETFRHLNTPQDDNPVQLFKSLIYMTQVKVPIHSSESLAQQSKTRSAGGADNKFSKPLENISTSLFYIYQQ